MRVRLLAILALFISSGFIRAQEKDCAVVAAMAKMARAASITELLREKPRPNDSYGVRAVFASRQFELIPGSKAAATLLLALIPRNENEQNAWMTMGDSRCDEEPVQDIMTLGILRDRFARDLAQAAILVPDKMQDYVWYAAEASSDPHSDYLIQMEKVCRKRHAAFTSAVQQLDGNGASDHFTAVNAEWFRAHIFNPDTCHALIFPEAD